MEESRLSDKERQFFSEREYLESIIEGKTYESLRRINLPGNGLSFLEDEKGLSHIIELWAKKESSDFTYDLTKPTEEPKFRIIAARPIGWPEYYTLLGAMGDSGLVSKELMPKKRIRININIDNE